MGPNHAPPGAEASAEFADEVVAQRRPVGEADAEIADLAGPFAGPVTQRRGVAARGTADTGLAGQQPRFHLIDVDVDVQWRGAVRAVGRRDVRG